MQLDIAVELADLASAKATLQEAEVGFQRQADLIAKRVTSEANLDTARAKRDTALAAVKKIEAVIAQKTIKAPVSGRLGIRKVERGQYVSPGMVLVTLQQLDPIRVDFPMPEQLISKLRVGQQLEVTVDTFPNEVFKGEIESLDARVAQDTRTLLVRGSLPNGRRKLLPGMFANVMVLAGEPREVVTVPRTAVTYSLYGDSVYAVKSAPAEARRRTARRRRRPNRKLVAERRFVKTGQAREDRVVDPVGRCRGRTGGHHRSAQAQSGRRHPHRQHAAADHGPKSGRSNRGPVAMSFTDIFIRRPVLATVVSLLILLVGLASLFNLPVRQYPEITNTTLTITTAYPGANAELIQGLHHDADPVGGGERRGHRHADLVVAAERQHGHAQSAPRCQCRSGRFRRAVQGAAGQERAAARGAGLRSSRGRRATRPR